MKGLAKVCDSSPHSRRDRRRSWLSGTAIPARPALTRRQIAKALAGAFVVGASQFATRRVRAFLAGGRGGGAGASAPATAMTMTFVNSGASRQPAGVPTQTFGQPFKDGDIPVGSVPAFIVNGVRQPYSVGLQSYWPSGCLKFAAFMLLPTFSLNPGASQRVMITAFRGSWPASSGRTLTDIYNQQLAVNAPPYPSPYNGRSSATLGAWLTDDANNYKQVKWLDGAAGTGWRISTHMAQSRGASKDGMLVVDHYVIALNNASGGLGGFRWMGAIRQPFYNLAGAGSAYPASRFVFFKPPSATDPVSGVNWQTVGPGGGAITTPLPWPFTPRTFTCSGAGQTLATTAPNNYVQGLPVVISGSSLPPASNSPFANSGAVADGGFAFFGQSSNSNTEFSLAFASTTQPYWHTFSGAGSGVVTPVPGLWTSNRLMFANKDAKYNFFQGTGSIAAETALRAQINQAYWQSTRLFVPFNLSLRGSSTGPGGAISDTTWPYDWDPYTNGTYNWYQPGTGSHYDLGVPGNEGCIDFYNQSVLSEKLVRICSLSAARQIWDLKDAQTGSFDTYIRIDNPANSYTGLAPSVANANVAWGGVSGGGAGGFTSAPPLGAGAIGYATSIAEHEPTYAFWGYVRTGELQYLDFLVGNGIGQILTEGPFGRNAAPTNSTPINGVGVYGSDTAYGLFTFANMEYRSLGWGHRDLQIAALLYPWNPTQPTALDFDGTQTGKYLNDLADVNADFLWDQFTADAKGAGGFSGPGSAVYGAEAAYVQQRGLWNPYLNAPGQGYSSNNPEWELAYVAWSQCLAYLRGNVKAKQWLQNVAVKRWQYIGDHYKFNSANGFYHLYHHGQTIVYFSSDAKTVLRMIGNDFEWRITNEIFYSGHINWKPNYSGSTYLGPAFTIAYPNNSSVPRNGDMHFADAGWFNAPGSFPSAWKMNATYKAMNTSNPSKEIWRFDVEDPNRPGKALVITDGPATAGPGGMTEDALLGKPPLLFWAAYDEYARIIYTTACWMGALGIPGCGTIVNRNSILGDSLNRIMNTPGYGSLWTNVAPNNPHLPVDARYCMQPSFA